MWPTVGDRALRGCWPYTPSLCPSAFGSVPPDARCSIEAAWRAHWSRSDEGCLSEGDRRAAGGADAWRVEKDPDLGSLLLKARVFGGHARVLGVMRHPMATYLTFERRCRGTRHCLHAWASGWLHFLAALPRASDRHAVVRFEDVGRSETGAELLAAIQQHLGIPVLPRKGPRGPRLAHGRALEFRGAHDDVRVSHAMIWNWTASRRFYDDLEPGLAEATERRLRSLAGYSLRSPTESGPELHPSRSWAVCASGVQPCELVRRESCLLARLLNVSTDLAGDIGGVPVSLRCARGGS